MEQRQGLLKHLPQYELGLFPGLRVSQGFLGELDVPVAELVPYEVDYCVYGLARFEPVERLIHSLDGALEPGQDPPGSHGGQFPLPGLGVRCRRRPTFQVGQAYGVHELLQKFLASTFSS